MNTPRPNHAKRETPHRYPSPVVPLYTPEGAHVGYLNRRTGAIFTTNMNASRAESASGKSNKAHLTRVRAANGIGFDNTKEFEGQNNRSDKRIWLRKFTKDVRLLDRIEKARTAYQKKKEARSEAST